MSLHFCRDIKCGRVDSISPIDDSTKSSFIPPGSRNPNRPALAILSARAVDLERQNNGFQDQEYFKLRPYNLHR
jgi:hypothetical protein